MMTKHAYQRNILSLTTACLAAFIFFFGTATAKGQGNTKIIRVMGTGMSSKDSADKDAAEAREKAIANCLFLAVETAIIDILPPDSLVQSFETLNNICYGNTGDFIHGYKVLTETRYGELYRVLVQARVSTAKLQARLSNAGVILKESTMPKILFLITEQRTEHELPLCWWNSADEFEMEIAAERIMAELFRSKGLQVIEHGVMVQDPSTELFSANLDNQSAVKLGILLQADVVVIGRSTAGIVPNTMGEDIRSFKGAVAARAVRTDTGKQIASLVQSSVAVNVDELEGGKEAVKEAAMHAATGLVPKIIAAWQHDEGKESSLIEVVVERSGSYSDFVTFRKAISGVPGVKEIRNKGMKSKKAFIAVDFQGNANALAQALMIKSFESFGIKISDLSNKSFSVMLIPN